MPAGDLHVGDLGRASPYAPPAQLAKAATPFEAVAAAELARSPTMKTQDNDVEVREKHMLLPTNLQQGLSQCWTYFSWVVKILLPLAEGRAERTFQLRCVWPAQNRDFRNPSPKGVVIWQHRVSICLGSGFCDFSYLSWAVATLTPTLSDERYCLVRNNQSGCFSSFLPKLLPDIGHIMPFYLGVD